MSDTPDRSAGRIVVAKATGNQPWQRRCSSVPVLLVFGWRRLGESEDLPALSDPAAPKADDHAAPSPPDGLPMVPSEQACGSFEHDPLRIVAVSGRLVETIAD